MGQVRRRAHRIRVPGGSAICRRDGRASQFEVVDASVLGIALAGFSPWRPDDIISIEAWWPGIGRIRTAGRVVRTDHDHGNFAMTLGQLDDQAGDVLSELALAESLRPQLSRVMIYSHDDVFAEGMARRLERLGRRPLRARSPLNVLWWLQDCRTPIDAFVTNAELGGLEVAQFLAEQFPATRRILSVPRRDPESSESIVVAGVVDGVIDITSSDQELEMLLGDGPVPPDGSCLSCSRPHIGSSSFCAICTDWTRDLSMYDDIGVGD